MAVYSSAEKRHRQSEKKRLENKTVRSRIRTSTRKFLEAVEQADKEKARALFREVTKLIDTAAGKGIYHKNNAARKKSRLSKKLNTLLAKQE